MEVLEEQLIAAFAGMSEAGFPTTSNTPTRAEREVALDTSLGDMLAGVEDFFEEESHPVTENVVRGIGAYCTQGAYRDVIRYDAVSFKAAQRAAGQLNDAADFFRHRTRDWRKSAPGMASMAGFAVMKTLWNAVDDCFVRRGHAFMAPEKTDLQTGLPGKVDLHTEVGTQRHKVWVKLPSGSRNHVHKKGITVVTVQGIARAESSYQSIYRLLALHHEPTSARAQVYDRLLRYF